MTALPLPGPEKGECEGNQERCSLSGCPKFAGLLKPSRDGKRRVRGCGDPVARGKRNRAKGDRRALQARKVLGIAGVNSRHEEVWGGTVLTEEKAGRIAKPVQTAYENSRRQSDASRSIGDTRPFVAGFCPDGTKHVYFTVRDDDLERVVFALAEMWGYGGGV